MFLNTIFYKFKLTKTNFRTFNTKLTEKYKNLNELNKLNELNELNKLNYKYNFEDLKKSEKNKKISYNNLL
jgi:hypothetical protein